MSAAIFYLIVEMAFNFGFWEAYNQTGKTCKNFLYKFLKNRLLTVYYLLAYGLLALVALLNAGRTR